MKKPVLIFGILFLLLLAYLTLWPVPVDPVSWNAPAFAGYTGVHAVNTRPSNLNMIPLGKEEGPEHIVLARDGKLYTMVQAVPIQG